MKLKLCFIMINYILFVSCNRHQNSITLQENMNCDKKVDSFNYPKDLESLEEKKYICDNTIPFIENDERLFLKKMKITFSDKSFALINFDRKTKILFDKTENLLLVFKASEIDNFYFNKSSYKELYPLSLYVLDEKYLPKYHFAGEVITIFKDNVKMKKFEEYRVVMKNKPLNKNYELFKYSDLIKVIKELNKGNYEIEEEISPDMLNYFYKEEPVWIEY
ncbi:hypothetical protein ACFFLS_03550 [Flavobacterium procerum]|uniref:Lipoprotein n=1 Tax=Flavobacterium procerum TaxID=1455569 RepID=A0ABV6BKX9_9FLAO